MGDVSGADGHELCSTSLHPTLRGRGGSASIRCSASRERSTRGALFELCVVKDALRVALDGDGEAARVEELLGGGRGEARAVLELLGLAAQPELVEATWACDESRGDEEGGRRGSQVSDNGSAGSSSGAQRC